MQGLLSLIVVVHAAVVFVSLRVPVATRHVWESMLELKFGQGDIEFPVPLSVFRSSRFCENVIRFISVFVKRWFA